MTICLKLVRSHDGCFKRLATIIPTTNSSQCGYLNDIAFSHASCGLSVLGVRAFFQLRFDCSYISTAGFWARFLSLLQAIPTYGLTAPKHFVGLYCRHLSESRGECVTSSVPEDWCSFPLGLCVLVNVGAGLPCPFALVAMQI